MVLGPAQGGPAFTLYSYPHGPGPCTGRTYLYQLGGVYGAHLRYLGGVRGHLCKLAAPPSILGLLEPHLEKAR